MKQLMDKESSSYLGNFSEHPYYYIPFYCKICNASWGGCSAAPNCPQCGRLYNTETLEEICEMKYSDVKIGDVVELNSGGPDMTVCGLHKEDSSFNVNCMWFNEQSETVTTSSFPAGALRKVEGLNDD